jgi:hypothetical protein
MTIAVLFRGFPGIIAFETIVKQAAHPHIPSF